MSDQEQQPQPQDYEESDWFLERLVSITNSGCLQFNVTLQVEGLLVSGYLVSGKEYFEGFAEDFASAFEYDEEIPKIRESFASLGERYVDTEDEPLLRFRYIHLKNAHFFHPGGKPLPSNRGVWWRGRLTQVSGFILGGISTD